MTCDTFPRRKYFMLLCFYDVLLFFLTLLLAVFSVVSTREHLSPPGVTFQAPALLHSEVGQSLHIQTNPPLV